MSVISGPISVSVEIAEENGDRRYVQFEVPESDDDFYVAVTKRWLRSFEEIAYQALLQENKA